MAEIREPIESFGLSKKDKKRALFSKIGVVGCGRDGRNIVNLAAQSGMEVVFIEISEEKVEEALTWIGQSMDTKIDNWGLTQNEKRATMGRITGSLDYNDLKGCDFVIECIRYEATGERSTEMRKEVFKRLESVLAPDAIIATNATTVIISELTGDLKYKERCISMHFPLPHSDARLLEFARGTFTSEEVVQKIIRLCNLIKFSPVEVKESSGFISMRLLVVMLNEACHALMESLASMEAIDSEFTIIYGQRYGIFELADLLGIEKIVMLMEDMFNEFGDRKYKAAPILWRLYHSRQFGINKGRGFYVYDEMGKRVGPNNLI